MICGQCKQKIESQGWGPIRVCPYCRSDPHDDNGAALVSLVVVGGVLLFIASLIYSAAMWVWEIVGGPIKIAWSWLVWLWDGLVWCVDLAIYLIDLPVRFFGGLLGYEVALSWWQTLIVFVIEYLVVATLFYTIFSESNQNSENNEKNESNQ